MELSLAILVSQQGHHHALPLSSQPVHVGRAPDNSLSLIDERLSWHHAAFWLEGGTAWVRDLASTNGTFINGERIRGAQPLSAGDTVTLGEGVTVTLQGRQPELPAQKFVLDDLSSRVRLPLRLGRLEVDDALRAGVHLPGALTLSEDGGLSVLVGGQEQAIDLDEVITGPGGERLRVTLQESVRVATVGLLSEPFPYQLSVALNAPGGRQATLRNRQTGAQLRITAETRVFLLYLLARRIHEDRAAGRRPEEWGWCTEEELCTGIWGRGRGYSSKLSVLVHRVRRDLVGGGFAHDVLERGHKSVRARLLDVELR